MYLRAGLEDDFTEKDLLNIASNAEEVSFQVDSPFRNSTIEASSYLHTRVISYQYYKSGIIVWNRKQ
jgi:hypothetical protein